MIVKMIHDLRKILEAKIKKMKEMFTKDLEELKDKQTEMNDILEGINSKITETEEQIINLVLQGVAKSWTRLSRAQHSTLAIDNSQDREAT